MAVSFEKWYKDMPILSKTYFTTVVIITLLATFKMLSPAYLYLNFELIKKFQLWRLISCFTFFGSFGLPWIFSMFLLTRSMTNLEAGYYNQGSRDTADMAWLMACCATVMIVFAYFWTGLFWLGPALIYSVLYIWSRRDPYRQVTLWGFGFPAWQYPFVLLVLGILLGNNPVLSVLGIVVGHLWYFLTDVVPRVYGRSFVSTPEWWVNLFEKQQVHERNQPWRSGPGYRLDG